MFSFASAMMGQLSHKIQRQERSNYHYKFKYVPTTLLQSYG